MSSPGAGIEFFLQEQHGTTESVQHTHNDCYQCHRRLWLSAQTRTCIPRLHDEGNTAGKQRSRCAFFTPFDRDVFQAVLGQRNFNCQEQKERLDIFIFSLRDKVLAISRDVRQQIDVLARSCENCICRAASSGDADLVARAKRTQVLSWKTEFWQVMA